MRKLLLIAGFGALLTGCVTPLTQEQINNANYGEYPANYERIVKNYYESVAKDPDSLKYREITQPKKAWVNDFNFYKFGYMTCATVNGKNSYGGYVGYQTDGILINNGEIIHVVKDTEKMNRIWDSKFCLK